jgi:hypothetical protein
MDPVEAQLSAYNARDLERFLAVYSPDVVIEDGEDHLVLQGQAQMRERYAALFDASPNLHCRLLNRIKIGSYTIDEEEVSGWNNLPSPVNAVIIYRVEGDRIVHVRMLR